MHAVVGSLDSDSFTVSHTPPACPLLLHHGAATTARCGTLGMDGVLFRRDELAHVLCAQVHHVKVLEELGLGNPEDAVIRLDRIEQRLDLGTKLACH